MGSATPAVICFVVYVSAVPVPPAHTHESIHGRLHEGGLPRRSEVELSDIARQLLDSGRHGRIFWTCLAVRLIRAIGHSTPQVSAVAVDRHKWLPLVQIGMPVVTTTVLAIGAREMANEKAIVARCVSFPAWCLLASDCAPCHAPHPHATVSMWVKSSRGILPAVFQPPVVRICRLSALEELSGMEVLASDKTGTLTLNRYGACYKP